jgi:hypothetical protein
MHLVRSLCSLSLTALAAAQIGGDGRDGPFAPTVSQVLDTTRGPWFFTTISIPIGVVVTLRGSNPAVLHATGTVTIAGTLNASGSPPNGASGGAAGPGGIGAGGNGGSAAGQDGQGQGGGGGASTEAPFYLVTHGGGAGHATIGGDGGIRGGRGGAPYGTVLPHDPRGGSGGGGGASQVGIGYGGGGGGGVIVIHANGAVTISSGGVLTARGGDVIRTDAGDSRNAWGGAGSGGVVWLRSMTTLNVAAGSQVRADGGTWIARSSTGDWTYPSGANGFVRLDNYSAAPTVAGTVLPNNLNVRFPFLFNVAAPRINNNWVMGATGVGNDTFAFLIGAQTLSTPLPPYGTLILNPAGPILVLGNGTAPPGLDPVAGLRFFVPNDTTFVNRTIYAQAINFQTVSVGPRLTNGVTSTIVN